MKTKTSLLAALLLTALAPVGAWAQTNVWTNNIDGTNPNLSNPFTSGDIVASGITVSGIGRGPGINGANANNRYNANNWSTGAIDLTDYFSFTLTPSAGFEIDFNSFVYTGQVSSGTPSFAFRSSLDGYTANIGSPSAAGTTISLSGASYQNITSAITFRFYGFGLAAATTTYSINSFAFTGLVNAVSSGSDYYWTGNGTTLGGSGNWDTTGTTWSAATSPVTGVVWDPAKKAIFTNSAATVTVSSVTASNGVQFATDGYTLNGGTLTLGNAAIASNAIITDGNVGAIINSKISGTAGMTKGGGGTLTLGGANDYTGGTVVTAGRLIGTTTSLQGDIGNSGAVTFDQTTNGTYAGVISNGGSVVKAGAGTVTFSGANTYTGGTEVAAGRLVGTTTSLQGAITNNAAVTLDQSANGTYSGVMSGAGSLVKAGVGTVTLAGANTYSGGTEIANGGLIGTTTSLQGAITNNGTLTFDQGTNGTYSGAVTGSGVFIKEGAGTVTLSGANSYGGSTVVNAGALAGSTTSLQGTIDNYSSVIFNQATNGTYSGQMTGSGTLTKSGAGTVTVSGNNSYAGGSTVSGGTIIAADNNALGSGAVALSAGTVLASNGVTIANDFTLTDASGTNAFVGYYSFGTGAGFAAVTTVTGTGVTFGDIGFGNVGGPTPSSGLTNNSVSSGYTLASGTNASGLGNALNSATNGALNTASSAYFEVALTGSAGVSYSLTNVQFGSRSTSSGPLALDLRTSTNSYASSLASSAITNDSVWRAFDLAITEGTNSAGSTTTLRLFGSGGSGGTGNWRIDDLRIAGTAYTSAPGVGTLGLDGAGSATFTGGVSLSTNATVTLTAASGGNASFTGMISGAGGVTKSGAGTVTLSGSSANTYAGTTMVSEGTLQLNKTAGTTAIAGAISVTNGATLLISADNQVADTSAVTLSGGTIARGSAVDEVFGNLNLTADSFLDYGAGAIGTLQFGTYSPTFKLTVNNFLEGNVLIFGSDLTSTVNNASLFAFSNGFTTDWNGSTFTITAVPEPSTIVAALGLAGLLLWPARRRIFKDTQRILGLRGSMRDRLARLRA